MKEFIKGMDISTLLEVEKLGGKFYDNGEEKDLLSILKSRGVNAVRLRLWNDPYSEEGKPYGAGNNDITVTKELARRASAVGMGFLLDFHYSDFWADPGKQIIPKAWRGLDEAQLEQAVYTYTKSTLEELKRENLFPTMIQVGNELSNGLLWPFGKVPNYEAIARFVNAGIRGVRAVDKDVPIMLHLDNGGNNRLYCEWFDAFLKYGDEFQIIGLSYYPFWHGTMEDLKRNMDDIAVRYHKDLIIAEVSMGFTMKDYFEYEGLKSHERKGMATKPELAEKVKYPMTKDGQAVFMKDLLRLLEEVPEDRGCGFFYWEPAWIPVKGSGWATSEALEYTKEEGPGGNEWANQALFDYDGNALPALDVIGSYERNMKKQL